MPKKKKLRPMGDITLDLEDIIMEMCCDHDLQWGEVLNIVRGYMEIHLPGAQEKYIAGGNPVFYYGPALPDDKHKQEDCDENSNDD